MVKAAIGVIMFFVAGVEHDKLTAEAPAETTDGLSSHDPPPLLPPDGFYY